MKKPNLNINHCVVFNKGLEQKGKKEGLLKRLSNIEGKNEEQLEAIKDQGEKQLQVLPKKADKKN